MKKGILLAEIVFVIIIISILHIAFLKTNKKEYAEVLNTALDFKKNLEDIQVLSISKNSLFSVSFNSNKTEYSFYETQKNNKKNLYKKIKLKDINLYHNYTTKNLHFTNRGTVSLGGTITFANKYYKVDVSVLPVTGRAQVKGIKKL